jgi:phosphoribosylamine--glycine ligase
LISGIETAEALPGVKVFHAGTSIQGDQFATTGGRVLGVTARGASLNSAIELAYQAVARIHFENMHYRRDIGAKGLRRSAA